MKVNDKGLSNTPVTPKQAAQAPAATPRDLVADGVPADSRVYTPSPAWLNLLTQLGKVPEVRPEVVQAAILRLQQGYYTTTASADKTAEAMLRSPD